VGPLRPNFFAHISTGSKRTSAGDAGTVRVATPRLVIRDGPGVSVVSEGSGASGDIVLDVGKLILDGGTISASSLGEADVDPGNAGNIVIGPDQGEFTNKLVRLTNGSAISTRALAASGGNILINAQLVGDPPVLVKPKEGVGRRIELIDSEISTSVTSGEGSGGNIAIDPSALVLNRSAITAQADAGAGGRILIATDFIIQSSDSRIDASAGPAGIAGEVLLAGEEVLVVDQSSERPAEYLRADALMKERCAARQPEEGVGRLTVETFGRDLPLDGYLVAWPAALSASATGASLVTVARGCGERV